MAGGRKVKMGKDRPPELCEDKGCEPCQDNGCLGDAGPCGRDGPCGDQGPSDTQTARVTGSILDRLVQRGWPYSPPPPMDPEAVIYNRVVVLLKELDPPAQQRILDCLAQRVGIRNN